MGCLLIHNWGPRPTWQRVWGQHRTLHCGEGLRHSWALALLLGQHGQVRLAPGLQGARILEALLGHVRVLPRAKVHLAWLPRHAPSLHGLSTSAGIFHVPL